MTTHDETKRFKPDEAYGKRSLVDHAAEKAYEARCAYGGAIDYSAILRLLEDRRFVRYPVTLKFDHRPLQPGEFAYAQAVAEGQPEKGFVLFVHQHFESQPNVLPMLIAYHLVCTNYGDIAGSESAEAFGATLLGMDVEMYYETLCGLVDQLPNSAQAPSTPSGCSSSSCGH